MFYSTFLNSIQRPPRHFKAQVKFDSSLYEMNMHQRSVVFLTRSAVLILLCPRVNIDFFSC